MTIADALRKVGLGKLKIVPRGIYRLKDDLIEFPDSKEKDNRTKHDFRTVLVISNQTICNSLSCPCVTVVPMSHSTHFQTRSRYRCKEDGHQ